MIKVEVGVTTRIIPTEEGSGVNFIKTVSPSSSSPPSSRFNFPATSGGAQSMTGAATSLRAAAFNQKNTPTTDSPKRPGRNSSDWGGQRISLDDMLSTPSPLTRDSHQLAMNSWKTSPPLKPAKDAKGFTELKNKRRSSLPDKFVPNWNEQASNWRSSIGRRPPSWVAPSKDNTSSKDDFLSQKQKWNDADTICGEPMCFY
ncbi:hypothetical protein BGZ52_002548 [Haplosporangium bisporale]|nr:hypothetical protein BGZ52_002548 [Haplosporangium bisporale]